MTTRRCFTPKMVSLLVFLGNFVSLIFSQSDLDGGKIPIRIVNIVIGHNDLYGFAPTSSAYDVAFERARRFFPDLTENINRVTFYDDGDYSCAEAGSRMVFLMTALYSNISYQDRDDFVVVLAPGCTAEILNLGDFTREMDVPVLASTVIDSAFANKRRFPTVIAAGSSAQNLMVNAVLALLKKFKWTSISLICDLRSGDFTENAGSLEVCKAAHDALKIRPWLYEINSLTVYMDSSKTSNFHNEITKARKHSKILLLASVPKIQKVLLVSANYQDKEQLFAFNMNTLWTKKYRFQGNMVDLNMTDGSYVFVTFRLPQLSYYYEKLWKQSDELTNKALEGLRFCLVLSTVEPNWEAIKSDRARMLSKSWSKYLRMVPKEYQFNELQISAYETALMTLQVLNESYNQLAKLKGAKFSRLFYNRRFDLPSRSVSISANGMRIENVIVNQYDNENSSFLGVFSFDADRFVLTNYSDNNALNWSKTIPFPPSSRPFCEPEDLTCLEVAGSTLHNYFVIIFVILIIFLITLIVYWTKVIKNQHQWWYIPGTSLIELDISRRNKSFLSVIFDNSPQQRPANGAQPNAVITKIPKLKGHVAKVAVSH